MKKLKKDAHKTKLPDICDIKWCRTSAIHFENNKVKEILMCVGINKRRINLNS